MKILIVGAGGREHAIADKLNVQNNQLFCLPGNPGIWQLAGRVNINIDDFEGIASFCKKEKIELVIIGPEQPLAKGMTNFLEANNINVFGPSKESAMLETSKSFAKEIMVENNIPTARFITFDNSNIEKAVDFIKNLGKSNKSYDNDFNFPIVLKADGLAAGKGVVICQKKEEAEIELIKMLQGKFGEASNKIVIEEYLEGEEISIFAITDGNDFITLSPAQDYKKVLDNDQGKNTGGMGSYSPVPFLDKNTETSIENKIIRPIISAMYEKGTPFKGCLYVGLILTKDGPKVLEFNARFGDPETQAILRLVEGDFTELLYSAARGNINKNAISIINEFACCIVLASKGYPDDYQTGFEITNIDKISDPDVKIYQAGTEIQNGKLLTNGGRVLNVSVRNADYKTSIAKAYFYADLINFNNKYYRKDIAKKVINFYNEYVRKGS
ncbi:MAG TPA: phosphoribosylamine--glycine ligase [Candidatus Kapabacteria bacterium]|jgi:phosphoribosylamine--glycine ligase|nr:phosphoribosylamine--glycine ligase [Candidatus Kapabacteria bacterium]HOV91954.1 phosphoribosylamine--glycine ligase [Candidatus Kapabacteria bacterium]